MGPSHSTLLPAHCLKASSQGPVPQTSAKCLSHYTVHVHKKGSVALHQTRQMGQKLIYIGAMYVCTYIMAQCLSPCPNKVAEDGKGWLTAANIPLQSRTDRQTDIHRCNTSFWTLAQERLFYPSRASVVLLDNWGGTPLHLVIPRTQQAHKTWQTGYGNLSMTLGLQVCMLGLLPALFWTCLATTALYSQPRTAVCAEPTVI